MGAPPYPPTLPAPTDPPTPAHSRPFLLRRIKTDVETSLPSKKEIILYADMSEKQKELNDQLRNKTLHVRRERTPKTGILGRPVLAHPRAPGGQQWICHAFAGFSVAVRMKVGRGPVPAPGPRTLRAAYSLCTPHARSTPPNFAERTDEDWQAPAGRGVCRHAQQRAHADAQKLQPP